MNTIIAEDIQNIVSNFNLSSFEGKTVFVTGATGLIGKFCVWSLLQNSLIKVVALVRNEEKARRLFGSPKNLELCVQDVISPIKYDDVVDFIIHGASTTSSYDFAYKPVETIETALIGTKNILEFAKQKNVTSVIYLSSLEVYGVSDKEEIFESDMGYIDVLSPRSSYSLGKRMTENMCIAYYKEYNVPVKIARLAQTFGSGINKDDNRVFAQFARSVMNKTDIILHTLGETKRNYCFVGDAIRAIYTILFTGENGEAYNVANEDTYFSIAEMAKNLENENTKVVFKIDSLERGYAPYVKIKLMTKKLEKLGWKPLVNLKTMFERLLKDWELNND